MGIHEAWRDKTIRSVNSLINVLRRQIGADLFDDTISDENVTVYLDANSVIDSDCRDVLDQD